MNYLAFLNALQAGSLLNAASMQEFPQGPQRRREVTIAYSPARESINEDWHYGWLLARMPDSNFNCTRRQRISSPDAYGAYPFWDQVRVSSAFWRSRAVCRPTSTALTPTARRRKQIDALGGMPLNGFRRTKRPGCPGLCHCLIHRINHRCNKRSLSVGWGKALPDSWRGNVGIAALYPPCPLDR